MITLFQGCIIAMPLLFRGNPFVRPAVFPDLFLLSAYNVPRVVMFRDMSMTRQGIAEERTSHSKELRLIIATPDHLNSLWQSTLKRHQNDLHQHANDLPPGQYIVSN